MKRSLFVLSSVCALALMCTAYSSRDAKAVVPPYDSVTQKVVDGVIDDGLILVKPGTTDYEPLIREQLKYTLGQLNWNDAAPKLSWFKVEVGEVEDVDEDTNLVPVHYKAQGHIAWSRKEEMPDEQEMILPARGDAHGLKSFVKRYFHACTNDSEAERRGYFYFFYPSLDTCPMSKSSDHELEREKGWVVRFPMRFVENSTNTRDKYPEYDKIWEDHKLTVTAIFGKVNPEAGAEDEGVRAYNTFYSMLINRFGQPNANAEGSQQGLRLTWRSGQEAIEVHLRLVKALTNVGDSFVSWYQKRTQDSDVIIYSGHAGLGDNIDVLIKNAVFKPKKYQIFFVNGCDTFTYVNEELFTAHAAATPQAPVNKYLDIITNSVSVYFARMGDGAFSLVDELAKKKNTYHEILRRMDSRQRAIVDGEEDNTWPSHFRDWP